MDDCARIRKAFRPFLYGTRYDIQLLVDLVQNCYLLLLQKRLFVYGNGAKSNIIL